MKMIEEMKKNKSLYETRKGGKVLFKEAIKSILEEIKTSLIKLYFFSYIDDSFLTRNHKDLWKIEFEEI